VEGTGETFTPLTNACASIALAGLLLYYYYSYIIIIIIIIVILLSSLSSTQSLLQMSAKAWLRQPS
jgi:hypothetical protein